MVFRGQVLALGNDDIAPIHSPTSGTISSISKNKFNFYSGKYFGVIVIKSDGRDAWGHRVFRKNYKDISINTFIKLIYDHGIIGLGGSGFLSSKKIEFSIGKVHTLLINAAESEPYVQSDDCLMQNFYKEIAEGCQIIACILKIESVVIAIEDDKKLAFIKIKNAIKSFPNFKIRKIKNKYPSGSSKQLIKTLFNKEVPLGKRSISLGILIFNVSTIFYIKRAILNSEPLIERIITLSDAQLLYQKNVLVRIGTPISYILSKFNIKNSSIILGGPITGFIIDDLNFPILKTTSSILKFKSDFVENLLELPCIRCTACSKACPMRLLPEQLYFYSKSFDHEKSKRYHINECIECGVCEQVCPSNIPLLTYFKKEKLELKKLEFQNDMSKKFKKLFMLRQRRVHASGLINENIIYSNNVIKEKRNDSIGHKVCESNSFLNSQHIMKIKLESAINRAKLKRNIK
ncbi:MAG: electron transport complex subunit RsxC [Buchnera aphidicola (Nurudea ibofushi)]